MGNYPGAEGQTPSRSLTEWMGKTFHSTVTAFIIQWNSSAQCALVDKLFNFQNLEVTSHMLEMSKDVIFNE